MDVIGTTHALLARHAPQFDLSILATGELRGKFRAALDACPPPRPQRGCPLHPTLMVWLCLGMALWRHLSISNVFAHLMDTLRRIEPRMALRPVTDGALAHARQRLGVDCLRHLFQQLGSDVRPEASFHDLRVWALDGTVVSTPDTTPNDEVFGRHVAGRGRSAFPQFRLLTLSSARTHGVRAATWCPYAISETQAAKSILPLVGPGDLLTLDRGLGCIEVAAQVQAQGSKFLYRLRSTLKARVLYVRGRGDCQVLVKTTVRAPGCAPRKIVLEARLITYRIAGGEKVRLLTNVTDDTVQPMELVLLYHERWEVELGYDELKTHLGSVASGTLDTTFRGRSPAMVAQEVWATLALYNMVRGLMAAAGRVHGVDPRRIGFVAALETMRLALPRAQRCQGEELLARRVQLMEDLIDCLLDRYRRPRVAPRAVRLKAKSYRAKKLHERCGYADFASAITLELV